MKKINSLILSRSFNEAYNFLEHEINNRSETLDQESYFLFLCLHAIKSPWRSTAEKNLGNEKLKWMLLEVRHRVYGFLFPSFILQADTLGLKQFLPEQWVNRSDSYWDFLDNDLFLIGIHSSFDFIVRNYEALSRMRASIPDSQIEKLIEDWKDFYPFHNYFKWLDVTASPTRNRDSIATLVGDAVAVTRFSEAQAAYLVELYNKNYIDLYGIQASVAFCEASLKTVKQFERLVKHAPRSRVFTVAEILKRCNCNDELLQLFNLVGKPDWLLIKVLISTAYARGYQDPDVISIAKQRSNALKAQSKKGGKNVRLVRNSSDHLKIVLMTADLGYHAVSYFLSSIFLKFHEYKVSLTLLVCCNPEGSASQKIKMFAELASQVFLVHHRKTDEIAKLLRSIQPDLILEMNGLLSGSRLDGIPQQRDVPVVHYLGGQCSTYGLADTLLVDDQLNTGDCLKGQFQEKLVSLADWMCYNPSAFMPFKYESFVSTRPSAYDKFFVVGYFNTLQKCGPRTLNLFAKILEEIPNSVLLLGHAANSQYHYRKLLEVLPIGARGRVIFDIRVVSWENHMKRISICDLALDNLDHISGGTTTCDALAIGTPVISTRFDRETFASRMTLSILKSAGLEEMLCDQLPQPKDCLEVAVKFKDRFSLIKHVRNSDLCNIEKHSHNLFQVLAREANK